ncbi:hypothetical protein HAX54_045468 [Datura stramonium]|uniref:Uncharacterized protein n=1 Tax=Datura stramonium TaxID=4076 RepID=A0ABS8SQS5_DATST|nr:hypothetical protein [Datura stramonium]
MPSVGEWSHYLKGLPCVETIKLVDKMWCREEKDTMLLAMIKQMELLTSYVKGFHAKNSHDVQDYDVAIMGTKVGTMSSLSIPEVKGALRGVQDLRGKLLDLTTTVKSHEVIIQQLEERMNELAFQMVTPIVANNTSPRKDIMDDDVLQWEMEEEAIQELTIDVFMKGEELEEIHHVHKEARSCERNCVWSATSGGHGGEPPCSLWAHLIRLASPWSDWTLRQDKELMINRARYAREHDSVITRHLAAQLLPGNAVASQTSLPQNLIKLTHLCSKVDVVDGKVTILRWEFGHILLHTPTNQCPMIWRYHHQVEAPRSPPNDWWVGYHNNANIMSDEEVATTSYHEQTLPSRWVAPGHCLQCPSHEIPYNLQLEKKPVLGF